MPTVAELKHELEELRAQFANLETASNAGRAQDRKEADNDSLRDLIAAMREQQNQFQQTLTAMVGNGQGATHARVPPARKMDAPQFGSPGDVTLADFREWKHRFLGYAKGTRLTEDYDLETQREVLRGALHADWGKLWSGMALGIGDTDGIDAIMGRVEDYLRKCRNALLDRVALHERDQQKGENLHLYISALRSLFDSCGYEDSCTCGGCSKLLEGMLRDRFVCGLSDKEAQRKLLEVPFSDLTMEKALSVAIANESSRETQEGLNPESAFALRKSTYKKQKGAAERAGGFTNSGKKEELKGKTGGKLDKPHFDKSPKTDGCGFCGGPAHPRNDCPAKGRSCNKCKQKGHYANVCKNKEKQMNSLFMGKLTAAGKGDRLRLHIKVKGCQTYVDFLADPGASCTTVPLRLFDTLPKGIKNAARQSKVSMKLADGSNISSLWVVAVALVLNDKQYDAEVYVLPNMAAPLLSKQACIGLGLLPDGWPLVMAKLSTVNPGDPGSLVIGPQKVSPVLRVEDFRKDFPSVFDDSGYLGTMNGPKMKIELASGAEPVRHYKPRPIPYHWEYTVKGHLDEMVGKGVVEKVPVGESPEWIHPMLVVPKKNTTEPRLVVDLTGLNKYITRPNHPAGVPRDLVAQIPPGQKYLTTLDARHGYWQVDLDEESRRLTTFMTPWGLYQYKRNVMGLSSAGDEFTRRVDEAPQGVKNVKRVVEDIILYDTDLETHRRRIIQVLKRCEQFGITLHSKKCTFASPVVKWCGYVVSAEGYCLDDDIINAIVRFPQPKNITDVKSFCGLVNQFEPFSNEIAPLAQPLRALMSPKVKFIWESVHEDAFQAIKSVLSGSRILAHFRPGAPLRLETDGVVEDPKLESIRYAGDKDQAYVGLKNLRGGEFPQQARQLPSELRPYWPLKGLLSLDSGLIFYGDRLLIPTTLRGDKLQKLHSSHQGIERTLRRARQCVFWPGITHDVTQLVRQCKACIEYLPNQQKEKIQSDVLPESPVEAIASDLFSCGGKNFLVITDKYSDWPELFLLGTGTGTAKVTECMKKWIARYGAPIRLTSDGGPQFRSFEFATWCQSWNINHRMSSPHHPIANGHAEAAVKSMKRLLQKCPWSGGMAPRELVEGLLEWRSVPRLGGLSPAQRFLGRSLRTTLPYPPNAKTDAFDVDLEAADKKRLKSRVKVEHDYNAHAKDLPALGKGDTVWIQDPVTKRWDTPGCVHRQKADGRSHLVKLDSGKVFWRNRRYLRVHYHTPDTQDVPVADPQLRRGSRLRKTPDRYGT